MRKISKKIMILTLIAFISGCSCIPSSVKLTLPPEYVPHPLPEGSLDHLPDNVKKALNRRDKGWEERIETLKNIIKSTHK